MKPTSADKGALIAQPGKQVRDAQPKEVELDPKTMESAATLQERQLKSGSPPGAVEFDECP